MTPTKVRETVNTAWAALERIAYREHQSSLFDELTYAALAEEKQHRYGVRSGYKVSAQTAARLIVAQKVLQQCTEPTAASWGTAAAIRRAVVLAYGLAESLSFCQSEVIDALKPLADIDYVKDCCK